MKTFGLHPVFGRSPFGRSAFGRGAGSVRSKCPPPATGKWRRKRAWAELVQPVRNLPPAEAKAISGHGVSRSPPAFLAVLTRENRPCGQNSPDAVMPIGHLSNLEGH